MPEEIDVDKIATANPRIDLDEFRRGEDALKALQRSGAVRRSTYALGTPESKRFIRPTPDEEVPECLPALRRLR